VDVITCAIFRDCRLRGVGVVRGVSLPSPIDLTRRPYNTAVVTRPCDPQSINIFGVIHPILRLDLRYFLYDATGFVETISAIIRAL